MGAYLSTPITDKDSEDHQNDWIKCGASSMQGWRVSQEDAHNCCLDLAENTSMFAVYDGHGGREVAVYAEKHLPEELKNNANFIAGDYQTALKEVFLSFDKKLTEPEVVAELKKIVELDNSRDAVAETADESDEDIGDLREEATMPLDELMAKYQKKRLGEEEGKAPASPFLRAKGSKGESSGSSSCSSSSSTVVAESSSNPDYADDNAADKAADSPCQSSAVSTAACCSSVSTNDKAEDNSCDGSAVTSSSGTDATAIPSSASTLKQDSDVESASVTSCSSEVGSCAVEAGSSRGGPSVSSSRQRKSLAEKYTNGEVSDTKKTKLDSTTDVKVNGDMNAEDDKESEVTSSCEHGAGDENQASPAKKRITAADLFKKFIATGVSAVQDDGEEMPDDSDDTSDSDENFAGKEDSDDDDDDEIDGNEAATGSGESEEEEDEEDEEDDDEDDEEECTMSMTDEPGSDSGCTAVVALVLRDRVFVANAGDSRCVASRGGCVVDLSVDHKPEDAVELERITKAGGKVTSDGRVNGGLNLSRALGDHVYKKNADLPLEEQMISPLPDLQELSITPDVEFLVLACDGIWNYMSSQEVIDFVRPRLRQKPEKLSSICEELFDHCLSPHTMGDGTGCDNMTAVIVQFRPEQELPEAVTKTAEQSDDAPTTTNTTDAEVRAAVDGIASDACKRRADDAAANDAEAAAKRSKTDGDLQDFQQVAP